MYVQCIVREITQYFIEIKSCLFYTVFLMYSDDDTFCVATELAALGVNAFVYMPVDSVDIM